MLSGRLTVSDETEAASTAEAGSPETEQLPPVTAHAPRLAYSDVEDDDPTALYAGQDDAPKLSRRHRKLLRWLQPDDEVWTDDDDSAYARGTVKMFVALMVVTIGAAIWFAVVWTTNRRGADNSAPSVSPTTWPSAAAHPSAAGAPDTNDFVAIAISAAAVSTEHNFAGFGMGGSQEEADRIALSECRTLGNDDCLLVNSGIYHGCVSVAIDPSTHGWASGSGSNESAARDDALRHLTSTGATATRCSEPPGTGPTT
jgi:hypothetical protein